MTDTLTLKLLETRIKALESNTPEERGFSELTNDLLIGIITALRCAKINTAARMSEELAARYYEDGVDFVEERYPWMSEYR